MRQVEPKVFLIGETRIVEEGLNAYLAEIGVPDWISDAPTDLEKLIEVEGRLCYRSFKPGLNPNVIKVRAHNDEYLENILRVKHGSVIEHGMLNFIFHNVSRVFTHELVRHRVGLRYNDEDEGSQVREAMRWAEFITAYDGISQESLRFVRFDDIPFWVPSVIAENPEAMEVFIEAMRHAEKANAQIADIFDLTSPDSKLPFPVKKVITSAMRRIIPQGVSTSVGWSANPRTVRWVIEARTDPGAEEEIRIVFGQVAESVIGRYPNLLGDFEAEMVDGHPFYKPKYSKV